MKYTFNLNISMFTHEEACRNKTIGKAEAYKMIKERAMIELLNRATVELLETKPEAKWNIKFKNVPYGEEEMKNAKTNLMSWYFYEHQDKTPIEINELVNKRLEEIKPFNIILEIEEVEKDE